MPRLIKEGFKEFLDRQLSECLFAVDEFTVHIVYRTADAPACIEEARHRGRPLGGQYSAIRHKAHASSGQDHVHVFARQNQLFAINKDGTAHDRSHGIRIPNKVADALKLHFPDLSLPKDNLIELAPPDIQKDYLALFE